jgi:hypothetical protein
MVAPAATRFSGIGRGAGSSFSSGSGLCLLLQHAQHALIDKVMHQTRLMETHLMLGRMDVHIHLMRVDLQIKHKAGC